ncbi:hypothetical protein M5C72_00560 [Companilactobacillus allii]|uniref:Uncharacterized protein n=1 Tax=Companilactobacillus allii TaxID=1847728 RepID=A0A1P8Q1G7_9LACO|nr:hypothetical protein [Companilactobacillus allii]APX71675.1 hypothetical protein BTM29_03485 [Companilactobacillus allii]USQ68760.1 hypothetical protein M5C72_00560 [Companilactobacillus allii]
MRKLLGIIAVLLAVGTLISCSSSVNKAYSSKTGSAQTVVRNRVEINQTKWNKEISAANVEYLPSDTDFDEVFPETWTDLKKSNSFIIEGTVLNYEKMRDTLKVESKITIHVDKVIYGNKVLENQNIVTVVPTGFSTSKGTDDNTKKSEQVLYKKTSFPLPKIGSKVITGLKSNEERYEDNPALKKSMIKYGLDGKDAYLIAMPNYNFWVQNSDNKYVINNLDIRNMKKSNPNYGKVSELFDLTDKLNRV